MRVRRMVALGIIGFLLLLFIGSYVGYSNLVEALQQRGSWSVDVEGSVYLTGGTIIVAVSEFKAYYDSSPEIPSFPEYLSDRFSFSGSQPGQSVPDNHTFIEVKVKVTVSGESGYSSTLLDDSFDLAYIWAGGAMDESGKIGSFTYNLGPYVAYHEFSPYRIILSVSADQADYQSTEYLSIPEPAGVTDG